MKEKLHMKHFSKVIKLFAPNNWEHYSVKKCFVAQHPDAKPNYDRVLNWNHDTTQKLIEYLNYHGFSTSISAERIDFFMHYLLAIYIQAYEFSEKNKSDDDADSFPNYCYFINQHLRHFDIIDAEPTRWTKANAVSFEDTAFFLTLFLKTSNRYAERYSTLLSENETKSSSKRRYKSVPEENYELSANQKEQIQKLIKQANRKDQTNITISKIFYELIAVFFPKN